MPFGLIRFMYKGNYWIYIVAIVVTSFFLSSTYYSGYYNSDTAVPILQTHHFEYPSDLYYWGQARLGSFLPAIGHLILMITGLEAIHAISIANYFTLLGAYLFFSYSIKTPALKIALALVLFLPALPFHFLIRLGHPYGPQLFWIGIVLLFIEKLQRSTLYEFSLRRLLFIHGFIIFGATFSIWLSEYSIIFLAFLFGRLVYKKRNEYLCLSLPNKTFLIIVLISVITLCSYSLYFAKIKAYGDAYGALPILVYPSFLIDVIQRFGFEILKKIFFNPEYPIRSILFIGSLVISYPLVKKIYTPNNPFFVLFILSIFPAVILNWVAINGWAGRFFTPAYFFFWMTLFYWADHLLKNRKKIVYLIVIITLLQTIPLTYFEYNTPSTFQRLSNLKTLGPCGIIGNYWHSYSIAATNPNLLVATPNPETCRNLKEATKALQQKKLFLIKNDWFDEFPDRITLYDYTLLKVDETELTIEGLTLKEYKHSNP